VPSILYVEDDPMNADMLSRRLVRRGFSVTVAIDGELGLVQAQALRPDLILLDISLPKMDGWEVARRLKGAVETHAIPIVALTAYAFRGDRERALEAGCDDYDSKPIDFVRLMTKIDAALAKR
jgi:CheY-like chemotaxis protein